MLPRFQPPLLRAKSTSRQDAGDRTTGPAHSVAAPCTPQPARKTQA